MNPASFACGPTRIPATATAAPRNRNRSASVVNVTTYAADGERLITVHLEGVNRDTFTVEILASAASRAAQRGVAGGGALEPLAAFGLDEL